MIAVIEPSIYYGLILLGIGGLSIGAKYRARHERQEREREHQELIDAVHKDTDTPPKPDTPPN